MTQLNILLAHTPAAEHWGENALLSFAEHQATIHLPANEAEDTHLRLIRKAARQVDNLSVSAVSLSGEWPAEYQWAFASSFGGPKRPDLVTFCDDGNKTMLEQRYHALIFTRALVNETPEDLSPETLAQRAADWLKSLAPDKISCRSIVGEALKEAGWIGIYNVGRGSNRPPVLLELDYNPSGSAQVDAALVGKGITFDSGGYSIKSSEGMLDMKCDMGGAATVAGGLGLAIMQGLNKRVKLYLCCAENLISGHAYKLGDVLTYKNGVSVEVVNTDAEGRLVLADGLQAATESGAKLIIDAATLTGAAIAALGKEYSAVFSLDRDIRERVLTYAEQENERMWALPLEKWHQEQCPSHFADTANSRPQKGGGAGGASNAAGFLSRFVGNEGKGWVHMDLASAYNQSATPMMPAGASGIGIRTIARALMES